MKVTYTAVLILAILWSCEAPPKSDTLANQEPQELPDQTTSKEESLDNQPKFTASDLPYPFSSAVQVGEVLYLSGEIGLAPNGKELVPGGIGPETERIFERIQATLSQHGLGLEDVFKCTVMLADMSDWPEFNKIYAGYFEEGRYPTRAAMGVNGLALGARVELECWAYISPRE